MAFRYALMHLVEKNVKHNLYRIFFYDCPPVAKKMHYLVSGKSVDFGKSKEAVFRFALHDQLRKKRKLALRLGHLADAGWALKASAAVDLVKSRLKVEDLTDDHIELDVRQKGVDMRIGLDIASLTFKKQVDKIVLFSGDADFVPAAKLARREGVDFVLDPMWQDIPDDLNEHIDGLRSVCSKPIPKPKVTA